MAIAHLITSVQQQKHLGISSEAKKIDMDWKLIN